MMEQMEDQILSVLMAERSRLQQKLEKQISDFDSAIAKRKNEVFSDGEDLNSDKPVQKGQYAGMRTRAALQAYLTERGGGPVKVARAAIDLAIGGVIISKDSDRHERTLKILAANNRDVVHYDKDTDTLALSGKKKK